VDTLPINLKPCYIYLSFSLAFFHRQVHADNQIFRVNVDRLPEISYDLEVMPHSFLWRSRKDIAVTGITVRLIWALGC